MKQLANAIWLVLCIPVRIISRILIGLAWLARIIGHAGHKVGSAGYKVGCFQMK